jgi:integrase
VGKLAPDAFLFSNQPANTRPWNPDWATHRVADLAAAAGVELNIKAMRHYTASQLLAAGFDLGNTAARLGHSGGGATHPQALRRPSLRNRPPSRTA